MDREQVDGWLAGVDELLAGRRDDESVSEDRGLRPQLRIMDETHVFARDDERVRRVIEMQRNRDTGPPLPPMGRRVR